MAEKSLMNNSEKGKKALFIQRFLAFFIDMIIISLLASSFSNPFLNKERIADLEKKEIQVIENYKNDKISTEHYITEFSNIYYNLMRNNGITTFFTIILSILYFVIYQIHRNGQTLGKKLMKIRIISKSGDLLVNQMLFRSFLSNFILLHIINFSCMIFAPKTIYFYLVVIFEVIQYILVFLSAIMIMQKKDGYAIHDKLFHTEVVREA